MSDNVLRLVPVAIDYVPSERARTELHAFLHAAFPQATRVDLRESSKRVFIDPGVNLITITCPSCGALIDMTWWKRVMGSAFQTQFEDLEVRVPCCNTSVSLNDLVYDWPIGFARFVADVWNPRREVSLEEKLEAERILGATLRVVIAHY
jgi:hypothetical protein